MHSVKKISASESECIETRCLLTSNSIFRCGRLGMRSTHLLYIEISLFILKEGPLDFNTQPCFLCRCKWTISGPV